MSAATERGERRKRIGNGEGPSRNSPQPRHAAQRKSQIGIGTAPLRLAGWLDGAGRPRLASLHDDHTASAARYVVERHPDLIGEFLADDEQPPRGLPKQLVEAALGEYVAMEPPPRLFARLPDHLEQG